MKVLQTLGAHGGNQTGIFQYRRTPRGVNIDASVGQADINPNNVEVSNDEWTAILQAIADLPNETLRLTGKLPFPTPPYESLYHLIQEAAPNRRGRWSWNDSLKSYVCAILEHEGSIDLYHGRLGRQAQAIICLKRDVT